MKNRIPVKHTGNYQICIKGILDPGWSESFDGFEINQINDNSLLIGYVEDQAALHGVLGRIRDLGLTLIFIKPLKSNSAIVKEHLQLIMEDQKTAQPVSNEHFLSKSERYEGRPSFSRKVGVRSQVHTKLPLPSLRLTVCTQRKNKHPHSTKKHK